MPPASQPSLTAVINRFPVRQSGGADALFLELLTYLVQHGTAVNLLVLPCSASPLVIELDDDLREIPVQARGYMQVGRSMVRLAPMLWLRTICRRGLGAIARALRLRDRLKRALGEQRSTKQDANLTSYFRSPTQVEIDWCVQRIRDSRTRSVMVDYAWLAPILSPLPDSVTKLILCHDLIHQRVESLRAKDICSDVPDWDLATELKYLALADYALVETAAESQPITNHPVPVKTLLVPRALNVAPLRRNDAVGRCLFVGGAAGHNIVGMQWFIDHVWQQVKARHPQAALDLCGNVGSRLSVAGQPDINVAGVVADLQPYYDSASVCIVPLLAGSGFKTKLIEALAHGCPVVATSVGAAGAE